ncbi:MAG: hypothetical protein KBC87_00735 [Candidatus Pacebacteria bacterium]|nr:hypothetical protein [Candidatus Paceibacterota bacterium]
MEGGFFMDIVNFSELSNQALFRTVLNRLWDEYSRGGISHRRSYQSSLIEGFMNFFPILEGCHYLEGDFFRITQMRCEEVVPQVNLYSQLELPFTEMGVLSLEEFTLVSLQELCRWYDEESTKEGFNYQWPKNIAHCLEKLFRLAYSQVRIERIRHTLSDKDSIIREGNLRSRIAAKNEQRAEDFEKGINPWTDPIQQFMYK